ncbi:uncharacterized protein LOC117332161 [Pecten maximus]|uniref:uncharacterized protein LOC117332161 n=1 Tax=Pecten maximus TaxID=6579 RepID=UPI001458AF01|nr:uncharacterized protein LOC117332161 [Pecten maximus]
MESCPTCMRRMQPKSGNVENYPVAMEIVHLLQSLQNVASCSDIVDQEENTEDVDKDEDGYQQIDVNQDKVLPPPPRTIESYEVCDIHGDNLKFVCETCDDELICAKCIMHSTHKKLEISQHRKHLEQLLDKQKHNLLKRQKDDRAEEEKLHDMIERQFEQKEEIKDEIEEIAEEMFAEIHRKKEEKLQPIEVKADEYIKQLTERQEHIKDRLSDFKHVSNRIGKLSNDGTTDFCRKAKRLVKQADIALRVENKPLPQYQTINFTRNKTAVEDLSKLKLGDVNIQEVLMELDETCDSSDFSGFEEPSYEDSLSFKPPPPPFEENVCEGANLEDEEKYMDPYIDTSNPRYLPLTYPRSKIPDQNPPTASKEETIYNDLDGSIHENTMKKAKSQPILYEEKDHEKQGSFNPPAAAATPPLLPPFSGSFRKSVSVATDNHAFQQKPIYRVFLPFRPSGFTVVQSSLGHYYAFVTDDHDVKIFRQNGDFHRTISDLNKPFDVASQQHGESLTPLYVTDEGKRIGDGSIRVYSPDGQFQKVLVGKLKKPRGISISRVGLIYVCDEANILVLCPTTGKRKRVISSIRRDPLFVLPMYVMVSATGKILVSDVGSRELKIHDETRKYTDKFKPDGGDKDIYTSFSPGMCSEDSSSNYYVIDQERNRLHMLRGGGRSEKLELPEKIKGHDGIPTTVTLEHDTGNIVVF